MSSRHVVKKRCNTLKAIQLYPVATMHVVDFDSHLFLWLDFASTEALAASSTCTTSMEPQRPASCSGVIPRRRRAVDGDATASDLGHRAIAVGVVHGIGVDADEVSHRGDVAVHCRAADPGVAVPPVPSEELRGQLGARRNLWNWNWLVERNRFVMLEVKTITALQCHTVALTHLRMYSYTVQRPFTHPCSQHLPVLIQIV